MRFMTGNTISCWHNDCRKWLGHPNRQHNGGAPRRYVWFGAALSNSGASRPIQGARLCLFNNKTADETNLTAEKRLRVLGSLDTLGAGFTLASQDLDIRGAGNLLEKSNQATRDVGYELYQSMLEEGIAKIKSGELKDCRRPMINGPHRSIWACLS